MMILYDWIRLFYNYVMHDMISYNATDSAMVYLQFQPINHDNYHDFSGEYMMTYDFHNIGDAVSVLQNHMDVSNSCTFTVERP